MKINKIGKLLAFFISDRIQYYFLYGRCDGQG